METHSLEIEGMPFIVPVQIGGWPYPTLKDTPRCCGPGCGILELVIPETILFLRITPS